MSPQAIYPCLWFNNNAGEAAAFYCSVFQQSAILHNAPVAVSFELWGTRFLALNGGPAYAINPAVSYFVYCGGEEEIQRLYDTLSEGGKIIMPLGKYDWSPRYAWVTDRFGVNWQLDVDDIRVAQKIVPCLLFTNQKNGLVKAAISQYTKIFQPSMILLEAPFPTAAGMPEGSLLFAQFKLNGFVMNAMSSAEPVDFDFSPGSSLVIDCETQEEIDYFWEKLGEGGRYDQCGWLADRFGVSWQVVPAILPKLMSDPEKAPGVMAAFLTMKKFDLAALLSA